MKTNTNKVIVKEEKPKLILIQGEKTGDISPKLWTQILKQRNK